MVMERVPWMMMGDPLTSFTQSLRCLKLVINFASLMMTVFDYRPKQYGMI